MKLKTPTQQQLPHYVEKALPRLRGQMLVRQASSTDEAVERGNGHLYFTHPNGRPFPTATGAYCVAHGLVKPEGDDLFGGSQTYRTV